MAQQLQLKVKGPEPLIERFIVALRERYLVILTSPIKTPPGEEPHVYLTVVEVDR